MRLKQVTACALALVLALIPSPARAADAVEPARLQSLVKPLIENRALYGVSIGLITPAGTQQTAGFGRISENNPNPPAGDTEFEIGSITKVFTGLLLGLMIGDHAVALNQPVQQLLGNSMRMPRNGREITLQDLITHTSGLPRMPDHFHPRDVTNPYADYTVGQLAECLGALTLDRAPGARYEYSNLGVGLLGHALAEVNHTSYEALVRRRICEPLDMEDTVITLDDSQRARMAQGHDHDGHPSPNWDLPTLAGAGALRSTTNDMLKFLAANIPLISTPLEPAITFSQIVRYKSANREDDTALGWQVHHAEGVIWHNGQTGGYHSFAGFSTKRKVGVVVLSNSASGKVDGLGFRLLDLLITGRPQ